MQSIPPFTQLSPAAATVWKDTRPIHTEMQRIWSDSQNPEASGLRLDIDLLAAQNRLVKVLFSEAWIELSTEQTKSAAAVVQFVHELQSEAETLSRSLFKLPAYPESKKLEETQE